MLELSGVSCNEVQEQLGAFLEDMLSEGEYQAIASHLGLCPSCAKQAESIDALSNQIRALCRIQVPDTLADEILFQLKKRPKRFVIELSRWEKIILMVILNIVVGVSSFLFGLFYFKSPLRSQQSLAPPIVSMQFIAQKSAPPSGAEAELLIQTLKSILVGLGGEEAGEVPAGVQKKPFHWHLHLDPGHRPAIIEMAKRGGIRFEFGSDEVLILSVRKAHFKGFVDRVKIMTAGLASLEEDKIEKASSGEIIQVSIYFTIVPG